MVAFGFALIALVVLTGVMAPILAFYWMVTKPNHPLDERGPANLAVRVPHPELHKQLRGIDRG